VSPATSDVTFPQAQRFGKGPVYRGLFEWS
jgi:hypothetical protein